MANKMRPIHPGEQLQDELDEMGMNGAAFAAAIHVRIPAETGHRFRSKLDSRSGRNWAAIPGQTGQ